MITIEQKFDPAQCQADVSGSSWSLPVGGLTRILGKREDNGASILRVFFMELDAVFMRVTIQIELGVKFISVSFKEQLHLQRLGRKPEGDDLQG